ncbi:MAG: hypothetical protein ABMA64_17120 [Myxococcota bacterium]
MYGRGLRLDGVEPIARDPSPGFVGRRTELERIGHELERARLVSLVGPAGAGKSRVAREAVARLRQVGFEVACGTVRTPVELDRAVVAALETTGSASAALARAGGAVLVLDECEVAVERIAERVSDWLVAAPRLRILTTSRVALGLPAERVVPVGALEPEDARALFLARAAVVDPADPAIARVLERLDGLPLAIELAAARTAAVAPSRLAELLDAPLGVLGGPGRRSMAEVLERSFDALPPELCRTLAELSRFSASFDLDDVAAVAELPIATALDHVEGLVRASLLRIEPDDRYQLYAVVRERASRDRSDAPEAWGPLHRRLGRFEIDQLAKSAYDLRVHAAIRWILPDLQAAVERTLHVDPPAAERCGVALLWFHARTTGRADQLPLARALEAAASSDASLFFFVRCRIRLAVSEADQVKLVDDLKLLLPRVRTSSDLVAFRCALAVTDRGNGNEQRRQHLESARPYLADAGPIAAHWYQLAGFLTEDPDEAERMLREGARVARQHGDPGRELGCVLVLVDRVGQRGGWVELDTLHQRVDDLYTGPGIQPSTRVWALLSRAGLRRRQGALDEAEASAEEAIEIARRNGLSVVVHAQIELATVWIARGALDQARAELEPLCWEQVRPSLAASQALLALAEVHLRSGDRERAALALREAMSHQREGSFTELEPPARIRLALATGDRAALDTEPAGLADDRALVDAMRAVLAAEAGDAEAASLHLAAARVTAAALQLGPDTSVGYWMGQAERAAADVQVVDLGRRL